MKRYFLPFAVQELMLRWSGISSPIRKWFSPLRQSGHLTCDWVKHHQEAQSDWTWFFFHFSMLFLIPFWIGRYGSMRSKTSYCWWFVFFTGAHRLPLWIFHQRCNFPHLGLSRHKVIPNFRWLPAPNQPFPKDVGVHHFVRHHIIPCFPIQVKLLHENSAQRQRQDRRL